MKNTTGLLKNKEMKLSLIHLLSQSDVRIEGAFRIDVSEFENSGTCNINFTICKKQKHDKTS